MESERELLLAFIGSLCFADHLGDVADSVRYVLNERLGIETPYADAHPDWWTGLGRDLAGMGVESLYGSVLWEECEEE
jgi:hypothetical protein